MIRRKGKHILPTDLILLSVGLTLTGAIVGSYLATILIRWPAGRGASKGRSACDHCGRTLRARELVPLLSFARARGRCRSCGGRIDARHPAMEFGAAGIGLVAALAHGWPIALLTALLGWWLLILAALDAEHQWLPDRLTVPLWIAGLAAAFLDIGPAPMDRVIGSVAGFAALAALALAYRHLRGRQGLGGGDPKLFGALGAWLGWQHLPFLLLLAALLGLASAALGHARGQVIERHSRLPFGTYLAIAGWVLWLLAA